MKVLYYSNTYFADADFPLVRSLQQKGCDITYLVELAPYNLQATILDIKNQIPKSAIIPASEYRELCQFKDYFDLNKVFIVNKPVWKESALSNFLLTTKLVRFIFKGHFDIIHTDIFYTKYLLLLYLFRNKTILTVHDPIPHTGEKDSKYEKYKKIAFRLLHNFVLLNGRQVEAFSSYYNVPKNRISISRLGVYDCLDVFKKKDIEEKKGHILFFGRISPYKGLDYLCDAMLRVVSKFPYSKLVIAGGGHIYFDNSRYLSPQYVWKNEFIPNEQLVELIQSCEVVVVPYIDATQSGAIMTAYALGKPVIATKVGGLIDSVLNGETGILVPPKDSNAISEALIHFLSESNLKQRFADSIKKHYYKGECSWNAISSQYLLIYKKMVN